MTAADCRILQLLLSHLCFWVVTPGAAEIASFRKYRRPQARSIMNAEPLQIADKQSILIHRQSFFQ